MWMCSLSPSPSPSLYLHSSLVVHFSMATLSFAQYGCSFKYGNGFANRNRMVGTAQFEHLVIVFCFLENLLSPLDTWPGEGSSVWIRKLGTPFTIIDQKPMNGYSFYQIIILLLGYTTRLLILQVRKYISLALLSHSLTKSTKIDDGSFSLIRNSNILVVNPCIHTG